MDDLLDRLSADAGTTKGENGRIGVVTGSVDYAGPPALAGHAALRTGTDVVQVLTSEEVLSVVAGYSPNLLTSRHTGDHLHTDSVSKATTLADWSDAMVIGPGLFDPDEEAIRRIVETVSVPLVVDADAIVPALDADFGEAVFTPDTTEVTEMEERYDLLDAFSLKTGAVVVSTGEDDVIIDGDRRWENETGTPAMTVAGTGDTLAGVIASLLGQRMDSTDAGRLGTWILGTAGELAADEWGTGMMATDVIEAIPEVMR